MSSILEAPVVRRLFLFSITARLPLAVLSIGLVVHVQRLTGSFAAAGVTTAAYAVCEAAAAPLLGRLVDRGAQTVVLVASAAVAAVLLLVIGIVPSGTPVAVLMALSGGIGVATPPVAACLRSQLPALLDDPERLQAGYSLETSLNELTWVAGPPLVLGVGALWSTGAALALAGLVLLLTTLGYALQPEARAKRPAQLRERSRGGALRSPAMRLFVVLLFCSGVLLGADEVAVTASAKLLEGSTAAAAPLFALWGVGSFVGGMLVTRFGGSGRSLLGLLAWILALTLAHLALIPAAGSVVALALVLLVAGATIAPTESSVYAMVDKVAPSGTATEAFAWLATALAVGGALGAAGAGALADHGGPAAAYLLGGGAGAIAVVIGVASARREHAQGKPQTGGQLTAPLATATEICSAAGCVSLAAGGSGLGGLDFLGQFVRVSVERLGNELVGGPHVGDDLVGHVGLIHHQQTGVTVLEQRAELLQIVVVQTALDVARDRADTGTGGTAHCQRANQPDRRKQSADGADGEAPPEPYRRAVTRRLLVLQFDLDLALRVARDDRSVEVVGGVEPVVEHLDRFVI